MFLFIIGIGSFQKDKPLPHKVTRGVDFRDLGVLSRPRPGFGLKLLLSVLLHTPLDERAWLDPHA